MKFPNTIRQEAIPEVGRQLKKSNKTGYDQFYNLILFEIQY